MTKRRLQVMYDPRERKRCPSLHVLYGGFVVQEEWVMVDSWCRKRFLDPVKGVLSLYFTGGLKRQWMHTN